jgi:hypothetical protein
MQGSFSDKALELFSLLASQSQGINYNESGEDSYDFTRCVRPNGSSFGTSGKCTAPNRQAAANPAEAEAAKEEQEAKKIMTGGRRHSRAMQAAAKRLLASAKAKRAAARS